MDHPNQQIINAFFDAYGRRDWEAIRRVMAEDARWIARGNHPLSGLKKGLQEVIAFFDAMGAVMGSSNVTVEKLVVGANDQYVVESQRVWTNRSDGINLDHQVCVLWKFKGGKIVEGVHFFADPQTADRFFSAVVKSSRQ